MSWKIFFSFLFVLLVSTLLFFYWFAPFRTVEFTNSGNSNFSTNNLDNTHMQFHSNMRYPDKRISYKIQDCPLAKENNMVDAFNILSEKTVLEFYPVLNSPEISITCDSKNKFEEGLFIAGEGGPTNITKTSNFNVILNGKILLIKESECKNPNIAIHELLHTLGFDHSSNPNNILYNISECSQIIGQDVLDLINKLYITPSYSDLSFEDVSAFMHGKYLDANISVRNNGLIQSTSGVIKIIVDEETIKEIDIEELDVGYGRTVKLKNLWISKSSMNEINFLIEIKSNELNKDNNLVVLKIK